HSSGRFGRRRGATRGAAHMEEAVFGDLQAPRRHFLHLPPLDPVGRVRWQRSLARPTLYRPMDLDYVGRRHQRNPMARMPWLCAALLAALLPLALGLASQSITRGWLATVVAILVGGGQTFLELLHLGH